MTRKTQIIVTALGIILFFILGPISSVAQNAISISGQVQTPNSSPLPGVNVLVQAHSNMGTSTDKNGHFELQVPDSNATLTFSFIGYKTKRVALKGRSHLTVTMYENTQKLNEMVVVGYGSTKKSDITGSVSKVDISEVDHAPANNVESMLQGRVAGVDITKSSQGPNSGTRVRIRGTSSLNGSKAPLLVVDGFPVGNAGNLKQIDPSDIQSVRVLKDASASAIYGSRGANGVILVNTKDAEAGETKINIQEKATISQFTSKLNIWRDPVLMAQLSNEARENGGYQPFYIGAKNSAGVYYPSVAALESGSWSYHTDWDKLVFRHPVSNKTRVRVSKGTDDTKFSLSGSYYGNKNVYIEDNYHKVGYNLNIEHDIYDKLKVAFKSIGSLGNRHPNGGLAYYRNPVFPAYDDDGSYHLVGTHDYNHPLAITNEVTNKNKTADIYTQGKVIWQIIPSLKITSRVNYKYGHSISDSYSPRLYTLAGDNNNGAANLSHYLNNRITTQTFANYDQNWGRHNISATLGYSYNYNKVRTSSESAYGFVNGTLGDENLGAGDPNLNQVSNGYNQSKLVSGYGRFNYKFNNKYLLTFTARTDGSSKFGKNNKWAFFPSGAISWKAHNEQFIKNLNVFDQLKFRVSYGISGNQGIGSYQTLSRYGTSKYPINGSFITAIGPGTTVGRTGPNGIYFLWGGLANPDLKWETTAQTDLGVDIGVLENRLHLTFDYYNKTTHDLLRQKILPPSSSYDRLLINGGKLENKGFEATLEGTILQSSDWNLDATLIYSQNRSNVVNLGSTAGAGLNVDPNTGIKYENTGSSLPQFRQFPNILAINHPINLFYGYKTDGIIQNLQEGIKAGLSGEAAEPGEFKYVDINDDGTINTEDRTIIGNPNPDFRASFGINFGYKKFDAQVFFRGVFGQDILNTKAFGSPSTNPLRWTPDNPTNEYPRLRAGRQTRFSDWWIEDGSYVRIQNINLGYRVNFLKDISVRFSVNVSDLYTFTSFDGSDPEVGGRGIYYGGIPRFRKITLGVNLSF